MRLAAPVRRLEPVGDAPVGQLREAVEREGRPGAVTEEPFAPLAVVGGEAHAGVQVEARVLGVTGASARRGKGRVAARGLLGHRRVEASEGG